MAEYTGGRSTGMAGGIGDDEFDEYDALGMDELDLDDDNIAAKPKKKKG